MPFSRDEVQDAFRTYWRTGAVCEDWDAWADLFTEDARYVEHVLGDLRGREAIRAWIKPIMAKYPELYTAYEWHSVDEAMGRVMVYMQNRRDHPCGTGTIDFPGITVLQYAGSGSWSLEEDFWAVPKAYRTVETYAAACERFDPAHREKRTRFDWGNGPDWTRGGRSWADRPRTR